MQQFTKQRDITFSGKAVTVQRHLNIRTQQKASFQTLYQAVLNVDNRRQTTAVSASLSVQSYSASVTGINFRRYPSSIKLEPRWLSTRQWKRSRAGG